MQPLVASAVAEMKVKSLGIESVQVTQLLLRMDFHSLGVISKNLDRLLCSGVTSQRLRSWSVSITDSVLLCRSALSMESIAPPEWECAAAVAERLP